MKKISPLLIIVLAIISTIVIQSCQTTGKASSTSKMLKFNFEKGKGYDYEMISNTDKESNGKTTQIDLSAYYSMDVTDDDGQVKTINTAIDRFRLKMEIGGLFLDIDTDKPLPNLGKSVGGKDPMKLLNSIFGAIKGQKFIMKVDAEGKIKELAGFENMTNAIVDSLSLDEKQSQEMKQRFSQQFNSEKTKSQLERVFYIFPNREVKVGDSWQKNSVVKGEIGGNYTSTYKVTDIEGDIVTLTERTQVEPGEGNEKISGLIKGTIVVDSRLGLVVNADQDMTMTINESGKSSSIKMITKIKGKAR
ncbi:MAG TPA: DUF6263 family protein [Chitinophagaceae bacterium]|nr:DUF6263 family protein [Chitinophagaceae bacterium]